MLLTTVLFTIRANFFVNSCNIVKNKLKFMSLLIISEEVLCTSRAILISKEQESYVDTTVPIPRTRSTTLN